MSPFLLLPGAKGRVWNSLVDVGALLEAVPHGARLDGPLAARQVHQRHARHLLAADAGARVRERLRQHHAEHGVRAGRLAVHVGGGHRARLVALDHQVVYVLQQQKLRQSC